MQRLMRGIRLLAGPLAVVATLSAGCSDPPQSSAGSGAPPTSAKPTPTPSPTPSPSPSPAKPCTDLSGRSAAQIAEWFRKDPVSGAERPEFGPAVQLGPTMWRPTDPLCKPVRLQLTSFTVPVKTQGSGPGTIVIPGSVQRNPVSNVTFDGVNPPTEEPPSYGSHNDCSYLIKVVAAGWEPLPNVVASKSPAQLLVWNTDESRWIDSVTLDTLTLIQIQC